MVVILLWLALLFIQVDWVGFRYEPVLLNRALGKVHVFKSMGLPWWQWGWKLWGAYPIRDRHARLVMRPRGGRGVHHLHRSDFTTGVWPGVCDYRRTGWA